MKKRILTAAVGIPVLLGVIFFAPVWGFGILLGAFCAGGAYELIHCAVKDTPKRVIVVSGAVAFALPFLYSLGMETRWGVGIMLLLLFVLSVELLFSTRVTFEMLATALVAGAALPMMLATLVRMEQVDGTGVVRILIPFVIAFSSDAGAYFFGRAFGKRKLAPRISPHKTVAGAIGGVVCGSLCCVLYGLIVGCFGFKTSILSLASFGAVGSVVAQLGDLTFSAIKRQYGIKDYSNLLPGHGGVLDRLDSLYYLSPLTELWMLLAPVVWL